MPAPEPVDLIPSDLYVQFPHGNEMGKRCHFILRREYHARGPNGIREAEFFDFRETLAQLNFSVAIDERIGDRFVERYFRRPLRAAIVALPAFIQADVHRL